MFLNVSEVIYLDPYGTRRLDCGNKHIPVPTRKTFKASQSVLGPVSMCQESVPRLAIEETFHCCKSCFLDSSRSLSHARTRLVPKKPTKFWAA